MDRESLYYYFELSLSLFGPVVLKILRIKIGDDYVPQNVQKFKKSVPRGYDL